MRRIVPVVGLTVLGLLLAAGAWIGAGLPPRSEIRALARRNPGKTALMLQREEEARRKGRRPRTDQTWVPLDRVSRHLIHAVLASEDQKFFGHEGVDWEAVEKSVEKDLTTRRYARGGSTITQQLAKNLFFGTRKTLTRKLRELIVTWWLERDLTKTRILTLYLNVIEWGDGIYGCEAASRYWYGKPAAALTTEEAAGLAAMIPSPRRLNPRVNAARHERATRRVLWLMARAGYLGRDVAGLGAEPPPEPVVEDDEEEATGVETLTGESPAPGGSPTPASSPPPGPPGLVAPPSPGSLAPGTPPEPPATPSPDPSPPPELNPLVEPGCTMGP
jgi:monofunctional biosynthetic peptidoglycan transglycosylase